MLVCLFVGVGIPMPVLVGMCMRRPMHVSMTLLMPMLMVRVSMAVAVFMVRVLMRLMPVLSIVPMPVRVCVRVRVGMQRSRLLRGHVTLEHIKLAARDAAAQHLRKPTLDPAQAKLGRQGEHFRLAAGQRRRRRHEHVAADAAVQVQDKDLSAHDAPLKSPSMRRAAIAAPQPLSMFITTTPEAQLANMALSAALPPSATP